MFNRRSLGSMCVLLALQFSGGIVHAGEFGTKEEAVAMATRVADKMSKDGADATFKAITEKASEFHDRDLYPFVYTLEGVNVAHGANAALVGKNLIGLKDQDGKMLIQEIVATAKTSGKGWVDYKWPNPLSNKIEEKSAYVVRAGDYAVGVGVYRSPAH